MNVSINDIAYDVIELYRANYKDTDSLSIYQVYHWVNTARAFLLQQRLSKNIYSIYPEEVQVISDIPISQDSNSTTRIVTDAAIPLTFHRRGYHGTLTRVSLPYRTSVAFEDGPVQVVEQNRFTRVGNRKFNSAFYYSTVGANQKLYLKPYTVPNTGWFLPSKDELYAMYTQLYAQGVGGFSGSDTYWSSSETDATTAKALNFFNGNQYTGIDKGETQHRIRPVRSFTAALNTYSVRDQGPGGGLVFHVAGTTYYEAAPEDLVPESVNSFYWSNVVSSEIGPSAQGTAIGTGATNTAAIIIQDGHTASAAQKCTDYTFDMYLQIEGVFQNPIEVMEYNNVSDPYSADYPINMELLSDLKKIIINENFQSILQQAEDKTNEGRDTTTIEGK